MDKAIKKEALRWVKANKGLAVTDKRYYGSPRVSSEYPDCSLPLTFDSYSACSYGCLYCFAYYSKSNNPATTNEVTAVNVERLKKMIKGELKNNPYYEHFFKNRFVFHWGGLSDPFDNFEIVNGKSYEIVKFLGEENYPTLFSTKGAKCLLLSKYRKLFKRFRKQKNFGFQMSIITGEDSLAKKVEIGVPSVEERLEAIKVYSKMGYWTVLRFRPFIIGISDVNLLSFLKRAKKAGIDAISTEFYCLDERADRQIKEIRYKWLGEVAGVDDIEKYYKALSPNERGTYRRLSRDVKERHIKIMYKFCVENDIIFACSDPDFKELNMTPSCCGLPQKLDGSDLTNYSKNQQTEMIRYMRKKYWKSGGKKNSPVTFGEVYGGMVDTFLADDRLTSDSPKEVGMCASERKMLTLGKLLLSEWNNLKSPANPYIYFYGKVQPYGKDDDGNMTYVYVPSEYEEDWIAEGIDLSGE